MASLLIKNADWIVTMDRNRRIIKNGAVVIQDKKIVKVGKTSEIERSYRAEKVIDAKHKLVLPGLIDSHTHNTQILPRGLGDECDLPEWIRRVTFTFEPNMTKEDAYWAVKLCQLEMIKAGTTCFIDMGNAFPDETAKAVGESGLRGIIARGVFDISESPTGTTHKGILESTENALKEAEGVVKKWNGAFEGRMKAWFTIRVHQNASNELCLGLKELADKYRVGLQVHTCISHEDVVSSKRKWGLRDIGRLNKLGLLGPNLHAIHMGWANMKDIFLLKKHDVKVTQCPSASLHGTYGSTHGMFPEMLDMGVTVSLGSDSGTAGNFMDVVRCMYLAATIFKDVRLDETLMPAETVLEMATVNGAKTALWENEIGSIEENKRADITIFELNRPEWRPLHNPISNLVYSASGSSTDAVIVDGRILMENRCVKTMDEEEILAKAQEAADAVIERAGITGLRKPSWPIID